MFDAVNANLADPRRRTQHGTDRKHLGASLYLCPQGHPVRSHYLGGKPGYRCPSGCVNRTAAAVDEAVSALIRARLSRPDVAHLASKPTGKDATGARPR